MKPYLIQAGNPGELEQALRTLPPLDHGPGLAIVFVQDRILSPDVLEPFARHGFSVFGSCAAEPIAQDHVFSDGIVALILDLPQEAYCLKVFEPHSDHRELGRKLGLFMASAFSRPSLLLLVAPGSLQVAPEPVLEGIFHEIPKASVFGAVPSSFGLLEKPPFFTGEKIFDAGLYALVLDSDFVEVKGLAVSGWKELGTPKRITRSSGREVLEIEGIPATDFYSHYFDLKPAAASPVMNHIDPDLMAAGEYPILLRNASGNEVMRAVIQMDGSKKSVTYGGDIPEGSLVRFCSPNALETIEHSVGEMQNFRDSLSVDGSDAVLMFNCALRSRSFGQYMQKELQAIHRLWNLPLAGFSSWGEIGTTTGQSCGLHNTVISVVALRLLESKANLENSEIGSGRSAAPGLTSGNRESRPGAFSGSGERPARFSADELRDLVESSSPSTESVEHLKAEVNQLRREKRILGHFLRLTAGDLEREQQKSDELLLNILPASIAERLKSGATNISDRVEEASVLFADLVGFTRLSATVEPAALVELLNDIFTEFDRISQELGIEKIKTIGDAYMAAAGVPEPVPDHARRCMAAAGAMMDHMKQINDRHDLTLKLRAGIHSGPVAAGVIGTHKFSYDLWGDTVNMAQRMESHGEPDCIQVSERTFELLGQPHSLMPRTVDIKGKGIMQTYLWQATE
ncbi:MAG: hypothetical protein CMN77_03250 [Spirochaetaceae bacterium]|nr:hypothetical protein [Spirochaetaceae bacterium]